MEVNVLHGIGCMRLYRVLGLAQSRGEVQGVGESQGIT